MTSPDVDWQELPADPDLTRDLGYQLDEWELIRTMVDDQAHLMFLPNDEKLLRQDAFVVAAPASVYDVREHR